MRRLAIGMAALTLTLSACEMRAEISVNPDGSGTFGFAFGMEQLFFGSIPAEMDPLQFVREDLADDPVDWNVTDLNEKGLRGFRATASFRSLDEFREMVARLAADQGAIVQGAGAFGDTFVLERTTDGWRLAARGEAPKLPDPLAGMGDIPEEFRDQFGFGDLQSQLGSLDRILHFEFHVTLPGGAEEHNADEVHTSDGRTRFVWRIPLSGPEAIEMRAQTARGAGGSLPVLPIALVVGAVGIGATVTLRRRRAFGGPPVVLEGFAFEPPPAGDGPAPPIEEIPSIVHPEDAAQVPALVHPEGAEVPQVPSVVYPDAGGGDKA